MAKWLRLAVPVVAIGIGATGVFLSEGEKNCNDLVDKSNAIVDAANAVNSPADVDALMPRLASAASEIRTSASDYKGPFDADARAAADALDGIRNAVQSGSESAYGGAIDRFNSVVEKTNSDCSSARN